MTSRVEEFFSQKKIKEEPFKFAKIVLNRKRLSLPQFPSKSSLAMDEDEESQTSQDRVFEFGIIVHQNCHDSDVGNEASRSPHHVLRTRFW